MLQRFYILFHDFGELLIIAVGLGLLLIAAGVRL
jgi:hypothetical protein